jgi:hypothetical protein
MYLMGLQLINEKGANFCRPEIDLLWQIKAVENCKNVKIGGC